MQPQVSLAIKLGRVAIKEKVNMCVCVCADSKLVEAAQLNSSKAVNLAVFLKVEKLIVSL